MRDIRGAKKSPKRGRGGGLTLSPRENLLVYYEAMQSAYGWTPDEIDNTDALYLIGQLAAKAKAEECEPPSIEDFL